MFAYFDKYKIFVNRHIKISVPYKNNRNKQKQFKNDIGDCKFQNNCNNKNNKYRLKFHIDKPLSLKKILDELFGLDDLLMGFLGIAVVYIIFSLYYSSKFRDYLLAVFYPINYNYDERLFAVGFLSWVSFDFVLFGLRGMILSALGEKYKRLKKLINAAVLVVILLTPAITFITWKMAFGKRILNVAFVYTEMLAIIASYILFVPRSKVI